jgi:hypothetical protein
MEQTMDDELMLEQLLAADTEERDEDDNSDGDGDGGDDFYDLDDDDGDGDIDGDDDGNVDGDAYGEGNADAEVYNVNLEKLHIIDIFRRNRGSDSANAVSSSDGSNSSNSGAIVPPPLPLLKFDPYIDRDWNKITIFDGNNIPTLHHLSDHLDEEAAQRTDRNDCNRLHNPVMCKLLSKWFTCRSKRENILKQRALSDYQQQLLYQQGLLPPLTSNETDFLDALPDDFQLSNVPVYKHSWKSKVNDTRPPKDGSADTSLSFDSYFESGNLQCAHRVYNRDSLMGFKPSVSGSCCYVAPSEVDQEYDLVLRNDLFSEGNIQWYYFAVNPARYFSQLPVRNETGPLRVRFNITNMRKNDSLYNYGMKPVVRVVSSSPSGSATEVDVDNPTQPSSSTSSSSSSCRWQHGGYDICYYKNCVRNYASSVRALQQQQQGTSSKKSRKSTGNKDDYNGSGGSKRKSKAKQRSHHVLSFTYDFTHAAETVYFAHSFPYTYTDLELYLAQLERNKRVSAFFHRRLLSYTLAGHRCDMLTITAPSSSSAAAVKTAFSTPTEPPSSAPSDLRAAGTGGNNINSVNPKKPVIVITGRVHPGEPMSSYILQGIIQSLTADTYQAECLRNHFVFKIIPMLNPDGVIHGNYRCSLAGVDLNRRYQEPHVGLHPTIHAFRQWMSVQQQSNSNRTNSVGVAAGASSGGGVMMYLDIHGHSKKKNVFVYGCDLLQQQQPVQQPTNCKKSPLLSSLQRQTPVAAQPLGHIHEEDIFNRCVYSRLFPRLLCFPGASRNSSSSSSKTKSKYFSYSDCKYKVAKSKLGTGRVVCWNQFQIDASYTIEASFCSSGNNNESKRLKLFGDDLTMLKHLSEEAKLCVRFATSENNGEVSQAQQVLSGSPRTVGSSGNSPVNCNNNNGETSPIPLAAPSLGMSAGLSRQRCSSASNLLLMTASASSSINSCSPSYRSLSTSPASTLAGSPGIAFRHSRRNLEFGSLSGPSSETLVPLESVTTILTPTTESDEAACKKLVESYENTFHYSQSDYISMGNHICDAIADFLNVNATDLFPDSASESVQTAIQRIKAGLQDDSIEVLNQITLEKVKLSEASESCLTDTEVDAMPISTLPTTNSYSTARSPASVYNSSGRNPWSASNVLSAFPQDFDFSDAGTGYGSMSLTGPTQRVPLLRRFFVMNADDFFIPVKIPAIYSSNTLAFGGELAGLLGTALNSTATKSTACLGLISARFHAESKIRTELLSKGRFPHISTTLGATNSAHSQAAQGDDSGESPGYWPAPSFQALVDGEIDTVDAADAEAEGEGEAEGESDSEPSVDNELGSQLCSSLQRSSSLNKDESRSSFMSLLRKMDGNVANYKKYRLKRSRKKKGLMKEETQLKMSITIRPIKQGQMQGQIQGQSSVALESATAPSTGTMGPLYRGRDSGIWKPSQPKAVSQHSQSPQQVQQTSQPQLTIPVPSVPTNKQAYEFRERSGSKVGHGASSSSKSKQVDANINIESLSHLVDKYPQSSQQQQLAPRSLAGHMPPSTSMYTAAAEPTHATIVATTTTRPLSAQPLRRELNRDAAASLNGMNSVTNSAGSATISGSSTRTTNSRIILNRGNQPTSWFTPTQQLSPQANALSRQTTRPNTSSGSLSSNPQYVHRRSSATSAALNTIPSSLLTSSLFDADAAFRDRNVTSALTADVIDMQALAGGINMNKILQANRSIRTSGMLSQRGNSLAAGANANAGLQENQHNLSMIPLLDTLSIRKITNPNRSSVIANGLAQIPK